jgi:histidinol dehydrogenase
MQILEWQALDVMAQRAALQRPTVGLSAGVSAKAGAIIERVRRDGDAGVRAITRELDHVDIDELRVSAADIRAAHSALTAVQIAAIETAISNVCSFHEAQVSAPLSVETQPGVVCERLTRPIQAVGLYVPAGSAPLPSTVIMLAVPALLAGCPQRVLCTPPQRDGRANPAVLVAAALCNIDTVFRIGGAQAIAAMAYGTASVPKVHKIFGPGNAWVTAAKQLVAADAAGAALDMPAGPSEVLVIADDQANAAFVALDLLAQAEHDPNSQSILLCLSRGFAEAVASEVRARAPQFARHAILKQSVAAMRLVVVPDLNSALRISDDYAPEHLILQTREPRELLPQINNAGSVFMGPWSPEPLGDYCSGTNHVLPTYGHARSHSGLSLTDYTRRMTVQELSADGLRQLGPTAVTLAELEGLGAHAAAVRIRLAALERLAAIA